MNHPLIDARAEKLAGVEAETLSDTLAKAEALLNALADKVAEVEDATLCETLRCMKPTRWSKRGMTR